MNHRTGVGEKEEYANGGIFFQKRQKLNSSSFPSKQNPAISGMTSLVALAIAYILAHWVCLVSPKWESHHLEALALSSPQGASAKATTTCAGAELGGLRMDTILSCTTCCFSSLPTDCMLGYSQALGENKANSRQCYLIKVTSQGKNSRSSNNATYNFKIQLFYLMKYKDLSGQCSSSCSVHLICSSDYGDKRIKMKNKCI